MSRSTVGSAEIQIIIHAPPSAVSASFLLHGMVWRPRATPEGLQAQFGVLGGVWRPCATPEGRQTVDLGNAIIGSISSTTAVPWNDLTSTFPAVHFKILANRE